MINQAKAVETFPYWRLTYRHYAEYMSKGKWKPYNYLCEISDTIQWEVQRGDARIIVTIPPRYGKSEFISKWFPTYQIDTFPTKRVILTSYGERFAAKWGRRVRDEIRYNPDSIARINIDASSKSSWETTLGGGMITAGVGGPITGEGGDILIIDDPIKNWREAMSETVREGVKDWFLSTFYTRCEPGANIIVVQTRWHEDDLAGFLLNEHDDDWLLISYKAIAEEPDSLGRKKGDPLNKNRYPIGRLNKIRKTIGSRIFDALYQQDPSLEGGEIFKKDWWRYWSYDGNIRNTNKLPDFREFDIIIQSWDMAFSKTDSSSYVCGQVWGRKTPDYYLIDEVRERMTFTETLSAFRELTDTYPEAVGKLVENKANGPAVIDSLSSEVDGIIPINPTGSKKARAEAGAPLVEAGNVYLPHPREKKWTRDYVDEHKKFPYGADDDRIDCQSQALHYMRDKELYFAGLEDKTETQQIRRRRQRNPVYKRIF